MKNQIQCAVNILRDGGLVAFPTETVYGLGADARNAKALQKIFTVKQRPSNHPLIVHIAHKDQLSHWAADIPAKALRLVDAFWPGPLTIVLQKSPTVLSEVTGNQNTIALRCPRHPIAQQLLTEFGGGIAAPSANKFTHLSPTTASAVQQELGSEIDLILDGGNCEVGLESTILDLSGDQPCLLRPGMLSLTELELTLGETVLQPAQAGSTIRMPGMHLLHYAPHTETHLVESLSDLPVALDKRTVYLTHSQPAFKTSDSLTIHLMPDTPENYAHCLYHTLRQYDNGDYQCILIESLPVDPRWSAIQDRLNKASAKRNNR